MEAQTDLAEALADAPSTGYDAAAEGGASREDAAAAGAAVGEAIKPGTVAEIVKHANEAAVTAEQPVEEAEITAAVATLVIKVEESRVESAQAAAEDANKFIEAAASPQQQNAIEGVLDAAVQPAGKDSKATVELIAEAAVAGNVDATGSYAVER